MARPNNIVAKQIKYQSSTLPLYLRQPRSKLYFGIYGAVFTVGTLGALTGLAQIIIGKPASE